MGVNGRYLDAGVGNMSAFSDRRRELVPPAASHFGGLPVRKCWCESGLVGADRWRVGFIAPGGAEAKARAAAPAGRRSQSGVWMSRNGAWVEPSIVAALGRKRPFHDIVPRTVTMWRTPPTAPCRGGPPLRALSPEFRPRRVWPARSATPASPGSRLRQESLQGCLPGWRLIPHHRRPGRWR